MKDTLMCVRRGGLRAAALLFVVLLAAPVSTGSAQAAGKADAQAYTVRLSVGASGFEPSRVTVPMGIVHFVVSSRDGDHCFAIPALDVEKRVRTARPLEVDVTFERAGDFPFVCCVEAANTPERGVIVATPTK